MIQETELNLDWLERRSKQHDSTAGTVANRKVRQVKRAVQRLRDFADLKPGKVADNCNRFADVWQGRLDSVTRSKA